MLNIPYGRQSIDQADIDAVVEVLKSDFLTQGPAVERLEKACRDACGAPFAVACNSATSALHIAYGSLGVGPGDVVWTSPITFVATSNAALYCGADVDFVDIDPRTYNLCPNALEEKLKSAKKLPKVVTPVHLTGQPCDMKAIRALSQNYGFKVVEDASHAVGARYEDEKTGQCTFSDACVFSFHPVKIVTTGEGGIITTQDPELAAKMARFRTHGITRDPALMQETNPGGWYYEQIELGYNYRITDLQAALGVSQFSKLEGFVKRRHEIANRYVEKLSGTGIGLPYQLPGTYNAYHLFVIQVENRREAFAAMRAAGVHVNVHYIPVYWQPYYQRFGFEKGYCPRAEAYYERAISIPMYADLTDEMQDQVIEVVKKSCGVAMSV